MKLVGIKEFAIAAFDLKTEIFIVNIASLAIFEEIYLFYNAQIIPLKLDEAI